MDNTAYGEIKAYQIKKNVMYIFRNEALNNSGSNNKFNSPNISN